MPKQKLPRFKGSSKSTAFFYINKFDGSEFWFIIAILIGIFLTIGIMYIAFKYGSEILLPGIKESFGSKDMLAYGISSGTFFN